MFQVKKMSAKDFEFAARITDKMNWNLAREDFEFMLELEPEGCFVLFSDSERIGIATTISYGQIAWFGNLIVTKSRRKKGAGSLLVKHSLKYLESKNVETVGLYAYIDRTPFYKRLGFEYDAEFIVLDGKGFSSPSQPAARKVEKKDIQKIIDYDSACFGASRRKLLEPILFDPDNLCYFYTENGHVFGYVVAKLYRGMAELGPLVCQQGRSDIAINLLRTILNKLEGLEVSMCIPQKEKAILNMLIQWGFTENFRVARMFFGMPSVRECIFAAESLERG
jgi:GNAT superfamily N-acetyltransferase